MIKKYVADLSLSGPADVADMLLELLDPSQAAPAWVLSPVLGYALRICARPVEAVVPAGDSWDLFLGFVGFRDDLFVGLGNSVVEGLLQSLIFLL